MTRESLLAWREHFRKMLRILRRPGGAEALQRHLEAAEWETQSICPPDHCVECGSTDFEPTSTRADHGRVQVLELRCRACGHINSFRETHNPLR